MRGDVGGEYPIGRPAGFSAARAIARSATMAAGEPLDLREGTGDKELLEERKGREEDGEGGDLGAPEKTEPACPGAEQDSRDSGGGGESVREMLGGSRVLDICLF